MKRKLIATQPFEFSARVTLQLGRESISSSTVAISELIKNSYDADAGIVDIDFHIRNKATSTLIIKDNGDGMNPSDLMEKWLTVGTDNKSNVQLTKSGSRVLTGAKGLGRLGIDRLCKKLVLYTKTKEMDHAIQLNIDWKRYENTDKKLSQIEHDIYEVELPLIDKYGDVFLDKSDCGTRMLLIGLKDDWDEKFLLVLENELRLLVSPFHSNNEFSINLSATKGKETSNKQLSSEEFLSVAKWEVTADINSDGMITATYENKVKELEIKHENIPWIDWIKGVGNKPTFGPVQLKFFYIPQDRTSLNKIKLKARDFQRFMRMNRGVRIYRDHFRVRPYGEPSGKGDWLDIGYRKASSPGGIAQGGWRVGPNQLLGSVLISRTTNSILNDQANREGIVENDAFYHLRAFILKVIETFELLAHRDAAGDEEGELSEFLADLLKQSNEATIQAANSLKSTITAKKRRKKKKKQPSQQQLIQQRLAEFEKAQQRQQDAQEKYLLALQSEKQQLQEQKDTLSNLASLGILTVCFGHEIRQHTSQASVNALEIEELINDAKNPAFNFDFDDCQVLAQRIRKSIKYIENFSQLTLSNIKPDKRKRRKINIPEIFNYVFDLMSDTFNVMGIRCESIFNDVSDKDINVFSFEIDWESIAINLITNSMWAMENTSKEDRVIQIEYDVLNEESVVIKFRDSGIGLEKDTEEQIFLPMNSSKRDIAGNAVGTGMGLSIVKNHIVDHASGSVSAIANSSIGGAEFIFELPVAK